MEKSALQSGDYHEFYAGYIGVLSEGVLLDQLKAGKILVEGHLARIPEDKWLYAYDLGKWTLAELFLHLLDTERIFQYRALRIAREDNTPLAGFDQDIYIQPSKANERTKDSVLEEFISIRDASISLFKSFDQEVLRRKGTVSGFPMSVGAAGFIICGHGQHHLNIVEQRYLA